MSRISALWRLEAFLDRDRSLSEEQRLALLVWMLRLQDDALPPPAIDVTDATGRSIRVAVVESAGVVVTYRLMATGRPRLLRVGIPVDSLHLISPAAAG